MGRVVASHESRVASRQSGVGILGVPHPEPFAPLRIGFARHLAWSRSLDPEQALDRDSRLATRDPYRRILAISARIASGETGPPRNSSTTWRAGRSSPKRNSRGAIHRYHVGSPVTNGPWSARVRA